MSDDLQSRNIRHRRRARPPLIVMNGGNDVDDDDDHESDLSNAPYTHVPLTSPIIYSSSSDRISSNSQAATNTLQARIAISEQSVHYQNTHSNPSLSSPSATDSPVIETRPPSSTPGISDTTTGGDEQYIEKSDLAFSTDRQDSQSGSRSLSVVGKLKQHVTNALHHRRPSNQLQQQSFNSSPSTAMYETFEKAHQGNISLMITADCDNYAPLDITGVYDASALRELIFSKLQISDEEQPHFALYRTEIGSFAVGEALSEAQLLKTCLEEGDSKGSLKFLAQHASAPVHLSSFRDVGKNHVPPVLPYQMAFGSTHRTISSPSHHGSKSSTSDPIVPEGLSAGYDGSVSDDVDRSIWSPSLARSPGGGMTSFPLPSPSIQSEKGRSHAQPTSLSQALSPKSSKSDDARAAGSLFQGGHPGSETNTGLENSKTAILEEGERGRKYDRQQEPLRIKRNNRNDASKYLQEPWVVVPSARVQPLVASQSSSAARPRAYQPSSRSTPHTADVNGKYQLITSHPYSASAHVPLSNSSQHHASPFASSTTSLHRPVGQPVPPNWAIKYGNPDTKSLQSTRTSTSSLRPYPKSMDNLNNNYKHPTSVLFPTASPRKGGNIKPSTLTLNEAVGQQSGMHSRTDHLSSRHDTSDCQSRGLPKSYEGNRAAALSPGYPKAIYSGSASQSYTDANSSQGKSSFPASVSGDSHLAGSSVPRPWSGQEVTFVRPPSALDDIGASPHPSRSVRMLPPVVHKSNLESILDREHFAQFSLTGQHARHSSTASQNIIVAQTDKQSSSFINGFGENDDAIAESLEGLGDTTILLHGPNLHDVTSPTSPWKGPIDNRPNSSYQGNAENLRHLISPAHQYFSTTKVDIDSNPDTVKIGDHSWIADMLEGKHFESTVTPYSNAGNQQNRTSLSEPSSDVIQDSMQLPSLTNVEDEYDDYDSEGEDGSSLWKTPPSRTPQGQSLTSGRPILSVDIGNEKSSPSSSRLAPNYTVPDYLPQPIVARRRNNKGKDNTPKRYSSFAKNSAVSWAFRPPAEDVVDKLEEYFPDHDLDKPMIEATSGGSSPTAIEPNIASLTAASASDKRSRHKKSIRLVAAEHKRRIDRSSRSDSSSVASILRKRSTKLWGSKVEELTPSHAKFSIPSAVPESPPGPPNPKPIFKWVRGELIGKGTYGRVYLALNATTGEMIAVKQVEIPKTDSDRDDSRQITLVEALKLESETLKDLDHPNIVQYLGFEQTPDFLSIFLEYVPGGSVASCLRKHGKFEDEITRSFTGQILSGLEYLHSNAFKKDMKADNILVDPSGICKISDFGISKRTDDINANGAFTGMQGSVFWMAPEVVNPRRNGTKLGYNGKVDIWSLGCVVLEMWAGRRPWQDADAIAVIYELVTNQGAPPVPSDVVLSSEADDFRKKCFAIKPSERPTAAELHTHPYLVLHPGWTFSGFKS